MSMPIQRQSEAFGIFDDGPRFARDRSSTDLPRGLAGLINTMGPRIQAGLLNTREAGWHTPDYDPRVDGYAHDSYAPSQSDFAEEDAENERRRNYPRGQGAPHDYDKYGDPDPDLVSLEETADPERFLSHRRGSGRLPFDRTAAPMAAPPMPQMAIAGGYQIGHRVGLPWRDRVIPGTVVGGDPTTVQVIWDDQQKSFEEPHNIQLL